MLFLVAGGNYSLTGQGSYILRDGAITPVSGSRFLVVSDLDDTLVGDDAGQSCHPSISVLAATQHLAKFAPSVLIHQCPSAIARYQDANLQSSKRHDLHISSHAPLQFASLPGLCDEALGIFLGRVDVWTKLYLGYHMARQVLPNIYSTWLQQLSLDNAIA